MRLNPAWEGVARVPLTRTWLAHGAASADIAPPRKWTLRGARHASKQKGVGAVGAGTNAPQLKLQQAWAIVCITRVAVMLAYLIWSHAGLNRGPYGYWPYALTN